MHSPAAGVEEEVNTDATTPEAHPLHDDDEEDDEVVDDDTGAAEVDADGVGKDDVWSWFSGEGVGGYLTRCINSRFLK